MNNHNTVTLQNSGDTMGDSEYSRILEFLLHYFLDFSVSLGVDACSSLINQYQSFGFQKCSWNIQELPFSSTQIFPIFHYLEGKAISELKLRPKAYFFEYCPYLLIGVLAGWVDVLYDIIVTSLTVPEKRKWSCMMVLICLRTRLEGTFVRFFPSISMIP